MCAALAAHMSRTNRSLCSCFLRAWRCRGRRAKRECAFEAWSISNRVWNATPRRVAHKESAAQVQIHNILNSRAGWIPMFDLSRNRCVFLIQRPPGFEARHVSMTQHQPRATDSVPVSRPSDDADDLRSLLARCHKGDQAAWSRIVQMHAGLVYSIARHHDLPEDRCDDIAQLVFTALLKHAGNIKDAVALLAWLAATAHNAESLSRQIGDAHTHTYHASSSHDAWLCFQATSACRTGRILPQACSVSKV